jgi:uncharacterized protein (DUF2164 family)
MNKEELIVKYLDDQLSSKEKRNFEIELNNSEELQKVFQRYKDLKFKIDELKQIDQKELYFNSILPSFHQKLEKQQKRTVYKNLGYAFSLLFMFAVSFIVFNLFYAENKNPTDLIQFAKSLTEDEKIELLSTLNGDFTTEYFTEQFSEYYNQNIENTLSVIEDKNQLAVLYNIEIENPSDYLSEQEFEKIYNEIINMNFFSEEKL